MLKQILEVTWMNLKSLSARCGSAAVIVVGIAGVVAVLIGLLSMAAGFESALASSSQPDRAIILRTGTTSEDDSWMSNEELAIISALEGVTIASGELFVIVDLPLKRTGKPRNRRWPRRSTGGIRCPAGTRHRRRTAVRGGSKRADGGHWRRPRVCGTRCRRPGRAAGW